MYMVMWKNARSAFFHITIYMERAPQARTSGSAGKQIHFYVEANRQWYNKRMQEP